MTEDKLTHDERLRLECLAQATALFTMSGNKPSPEILTKTAEAFEVYVRGATNAN